MTAQRRSESLQDTPLAISALSGNSLQSAGINNVVAPNNDLPNVNINETSGTVRITIRGIGIVASQPNAEGAIAYHVDGVYVSRPEAVGDGFFDVDRIEVVRGPQGTLYGRNATGGAINLITRDPTDTFQGNAEIRVGNYSMITTEAGIGGPIADGVSFRIAGQTVDRDGWGRDGQGLPLNDQRTRAIRGKLKFEPSYNFTNLLSADYFHEDDSSGAYLVTAAGIPGRVPIGVQFGFPLAEDPRRDSNGDFPAILQKDNWSITQHGQSGNFAAVQHHFDYRISLGRFLSAV